MVKRILRKGIEAQLPAGYDIDTHFTPTYDPWDQRLCIVPEGDLFTAISGGRASVVTDHIDTFTESGLRLRSGDEIEADVVVTATGLDLLFLGGIALTVDGETVDPAERLTYKGMMLEGVPNLALAVGYTNASWTLKSELTCAYVCRLLTHLRQSGLRQCTPFNDDAAVSATPLLGLNAGYVLRSAHLFPKQGSQAPWQVNQSYLQDYRALKRGKLVDGAMIFSNPAVEPEFPMADPTAVGPLTDFRGRVAAITGAGSGIGRALAIELAGQGAHLALSDVDETALKETAVSCEEAGVTVTTARVDVSDRDAVHAWANQVVADHGRVNLVVNNAGVSLMAPIADMSYEDLDWLMGVNFWGVVHGTKAFLPHLKAGGEGHIVNVSSVFGLLSIPSQSAYNAAKFGVRGFTDALRMELEIEGVDVSATTVHPGGIKTNIARNGRFNPEMEAARDEFDKVARTSPEAAARAILRAVERNQRRLLIGPDAKAMDLLARLPTSIYQKAIVRGARRRIAKDAAADS